MAKRKGRTAGRIGRSHIEAPQPRLVVPPGSSRIVAALERIGKLGEWRFAVLLLVGFHVLLFVVAMTLGRALPRETFSGNWEELVYSGPGAEFISFWQRWDALWYQHIAEEGYRAGDGTTAFFPLYPLLVRLVSVATLGNTVLAGLLVSAVAFVAAVVLLWRLVRREAIQAGWADARSLSVLAAVMLVAFPTAFFLVAPYTESLFLALTVGTIYHARQGRPWVAGALGLLAGLTRAQGVFLALPIAWEALRQGGTLVWLIRRGGRPPGIALLASAMPVAGMVSWMVAQRVVIGENLGSLEIQAFWGYELVLPWDALAKSWLYITRNPTLSQAFVEALNFASLTGGIALAVLVTRRMPVAYGLYVWPSLLLVAFRQMATSPLMSVSRYAVVTFPLFMVATPWLAQRPRLAAVVLVIGLVADVWLFGYWARWGFVA